MGAFFSIRIYNQELQWIGEAITAESIQFQRELYGSGFFEIHIHPEKRGAQSLFQRNNILVINNRPDMAGIVEDFELSESRNDAKIVIRGCPLKGLSGRRITVPPTQEQNPNALGWDKIQAPAETVIKHYAERNMINAYNNKRNIPFLIMAADKRRGKETPWKSRYANLGTELENIGKYAEMGYQIYADIPNRQMIFEIIEGTDRTKKQDIISPVFFTMEYQNVADYRYIQSHDNYKSTGYAGGQGEDEKRLIYTLGSEITGLDRTEAFLDCGSANDISELIYYGEQKMAELLSVNTIEASALPKVFIFEKDYFLGDKVTIHISRIGLEFDARITAVTEIWERGSGYRTEIRLGEKVPDINILLDKKVEVR